MTGSPSWWPASPSCPWIGWSDWPIGEPPTPIMIMVITGRDGGRGHPGPVGEPLTRHGRPRLDRRRSGSGCTRSARSRRPRLRFVAGLVVAPDGAAWPGPDAIFEPAEIARAGPGRSLDPAALRIPADTLPGSHHGLVIGARRHGSGRADHRGGHVSATMIETLEHYAALTRVAVGRDASPVASRRTTSTIWSATTQHARARDCVPVCCWRPPTPAAPRRGPRCPPPPPWSCCTRPS